MVTMGSTASKPESNWSTPLECLLPNLKNLRLTGYVRPERLTFLCSEAWPQHPLDNDSHWPPTGTLDFDVLRDLGNYCRRTENGPKSPMYRLSGRCAPAPPFAQPAPQPKLCSPWLLNGLPAQIQTPLSKNRQALSPLPSLFPQKTWSAPALCSSDSSSSLPHSHSPSCPDNTSPHFLNRYTTD